MANEQFERFMYEAKTNPDTGTAAFFAQLATTEALGQIVDLLIEHNTQLTELVRLAREGREAWDASTESTRRCNEMGGGSAGLDTAGDFAMHCGYRDGHDGPHSYEEEE